MGRLADGLRSFWKPGLPTRDPALAAYFGAGPTASGVLVNEATALNYSAWWAAVQLISNAVASLPLFLYRRFPGGDKERFTGHPVYRMLHDEFNPEMTSTVARKTMQAHVLTWGNAYAEIQFDQANRPLALWPITPDRVTPDRTSEGQLIYRVQNDRGADVRLEAERVLHIPGLSFNGLQGYSVIAKARETIGLGMGTRAYGARFFGNSAVSSLVAKHPGRLGDQAHQNLKKSIKDAITGDEQHGVLILEENMSVEKISIPPNDAQFLETQKFSVAEIARWFNVPPHKLGDLDRSTFANIEHQSIEYLTDCLRPWLVVWEQELNRKLIRPLERTQQFTEHLVDGLLRGDILSRYNAYAVGRQWGWLSANDVRGRENLNRLEGDAGEIYLVPLNMTPADRLDDVIDAQTRPPAPAAPPESAPDRISKIVEDLRAEVTIGLTEVRTQQSQALARLEALAATPGALEQLGADLKAQLATAEELRQKQRAAVAMVTRGLVRRELAQVRKLAKDPGKAESLAGFYGKLVTDGVENLAPLVEEARARAFLERWAAAAQAACAAAVAEGSVSGLPEQWLDRHEQMTNALLEALHGEG